jgi:hypothetical protein
MVCSRSGVSDREVASSSEMICAIVIAASKISDFVLF